MKWTASLITITVSFFTPFFVSLSFATRSFVTLSLVTVLLSACTFTADNTASPSVPNNNDTGQQSKQSIESNSADNTKVNQIKALDLSELTLAKDHNSQIVKLIPVGDPFASKFEQILSVGQNGQVLLWNFKESQPEPYLALQLKPGFASTALDTNSLLFAVAYPSLVEIYSLQQSQLKYTLNRVRTRIISMHFAPDSSSIVLAGADGIVYRWNFVKEAISSRIADAEKSLERYIGHSTVVNFVKFHPLGRMFVSSDWYGGISAWLIYESDKFAGHYDVNLFKGRMFTEGARRSRGTRALKSIIEDGFFSKDGQFIYLIAEDGVVELWQVRGFKQVATIQAHKGTIYDMALSSTEGRFATLGRDGKLRVWKVETKPGAIAGVEIYSLVMVKEMEVPNASKIVFQGSDLVLAGGLNGTIVPVDVKTE